MPCRHKEHKSADAGSLYGEAIVVGLSLVPVWFAVQSVTTLARIDLQGKAAIDVAIAGFLFHMLAEETGVNQWYLMNSHAARNVLSQTVDNDSVLHLDMAWVRSVGGAHGL